MTDPDRHQRPLKWLFAGCAAALLLAAAAVVSAAAAPGVDTLAVESVSTAGWPAVTMRVVLPTALLAGPPLAPGDFALTENGVRVRALDVEAVAVEKHSLDVVLVFDTSGSMKGEKLAEARAAASTFLKALGPADRVGLITFGNPPASISPLTRDRAALQAAIDSFRAGNRTALYDAVVMAARNFEGDKGTADRAIVVLSDGEDSESGNTLGSAASELASAGVPVYAVALGGKAGTQALGTLARASGGRAVGVAAGADLSALFSMIAKQLKHPYDVTFTSLRPPAKSLDLELTASSGTGRATASFAVANPDTLAAERTTQPSEPTPSPIWPVVITILVFAAVGTMALLILLLTRPEPNAMAQLRYFEQMRGAGDRGPRSAPEIDPDSVRGRVVGLAGVVAARGGFDSAIRHALDRAGLPLRPTEYMVLHAVTVLGLGLVVQIAGRNLLLTALAVVVLAMGPIMLLQHLARRRTDAFQEQLPDVLNLLASSLRAGWGLQQAVGVVVSELGPPAAPEFERVVTEARLGLPLEDALEKMAVRMESEDFRWAVSAIAIQREVGGNLAEVLDMVAATIRERGMLRRQVSSLTAEGRLSAIILIALPFVEAGALMALNPVYFAPLVSSPYGVVVAAIGISLLIVGIVWLRRVVKIEV